MVFSSMFFIWVFLPILLLVYFLFSKHLKIQNAILLLFSLLFYSWGEPKNIIYMIITILINYFLALLLSQSKVKWKRRVFLTLAIFFDLGLLGYFKYSTFLATNINHLFQSEILPLKEMFLLWSLLYLEKTIPQQGSLIIRAKTVKELILSKLEL